MTGFHRFGLLLATHAGLLACGDGTGPALIHGTYALRHVDGQVGPPFVISDLSCAPGDRILTEITGDTVALGPGDAARRATFYRTRSWSQGVEGTPLEAGTVSTATYRRDGGLVIVTYPSIPQQPPPPVDTFRVSGQGLEREGSLGGVCSGGPSDVRIGTFEYVRL